MLDRIIPAAGWIRTYSRTDFCGDVIAGLTVAVLLIPQAIAWAVLAGLPPVAGLYASVFPLMAYALFGSSRHLAIGPNAVVSLLVLTGCSTLANPGTGEYWAMAALAALMAGAIQLVFGLLRAGSIMAFVSHAVISGFTSAAVVIICLSQLRHLLGVNVENDGGVLVLALRTVMRVGDTQPITLAIGAGSLAVLLVLRSKAPRIPGPLIAVALGTLLVYVLKWQEAGVATVGDVPAGLPAPKAPPISLHAVRQLGTISVVIAVVGYLESMALVQLIAAKERYAVHPSAELRATGIANLVSGLFSGFPISGSFSRTAVNYDAGARTNMASVVTAALVIPALLFMTPLFLYLPRAVLAAVIIAAASKLIDLRVIRRFFQVDPADGWTLALTFAATLLLGIEAGIVIGVIFSLGLFIWRSAHPHTAELGYEPREGVFRDREQFPTVSTDPRALIFRADRSLYFANMGFIEDRLRKSIAEKPDLKWVIMDLSGVNDVDGVAVHALDEIVERCAAQDIGVMFAGMKGRVRERFAKAGWIERHGEPLSYGDVEHALEQTDLFNAAGWP